LVGEKARVVLIGERRGKEGPQPGLSPSYTLEFLSALIEVRSRRTGAAPLVKNRGMGGQPA